MFLSILTMLVKNMLFFTGSYSNNVFKEALRKIFKTIFRKKW